MKIRHVLVVLAAVIALLFIFRMVTVIGSGKKLAPERVIPVMVENPALSAISEKLSLVGDIKGETEVVVRPKTGGRVEEIFVKEGDEVKAGDRLLSFVNGIKADDDLYHDVVTFAPISGIVGVQSIKLGEQVQMLGGAPSSVFTIYKIDNVKIYVNVPEKYFSLVTRNTRAEIRLDSFPGRVFYGQVNNVRPVIDPMTRTTQVEIIISNPDHRIKPGMFSTVDLILRSRSAAMTLPADSVLGVENRYVFVVQEGKAEAKKVNVGIQQDNEIEILSGLSLKDMVIVVGQRVVSEGAKVTAESK